MRHTLGLDPHPQKIDGITVTSFARTLVDVATALPFASAVGMIDNALAATEPGDFRLRIGVHAIGKESLIAHAESMHPFRGFARALKAIEFANGKSGSPMESWCRVQFAALGYPPPELQKVISDEKGEIGAVDFYWPHLDLIVEFDGRVKYSDGRRYHRELSTDAVLWEEKIREDRMRRVVRRFARIYRQTVASTRTIESYLSPFGLRRGNSDAYEAISGK